MMGKVEPRMVRGYAIVAKGEQITQIEEDSFSVPSQNGNGSYEVKVTSEGLICSCPDFTYRHEKIGLCKHAYAVKIWLEVRARIHAESQEEEATQCKWCGSLFVMRYGHKSGKQVWKCKSCLRKFVVDDGFERMKYDPKVITVTLDLYFKGTSYRKIADHLKQFYELDVNFSTLYSWIKKYVGIMNRYVSTLTPNLSGQWHVDEMKVKFHGNWRWLWNIMDKETRFMLASTISETREIQDARAVFSKAKQTAKGQKPTKVVSDGLKAYKDAFNKEFFTLRGPRTQHISHIRLSGDMNNNLVERLNGEKRDRQKVMRGLKNEESKFIEGQDIYHNFIKPHEALSGLTPSDVAGLSLDPNQRNKWLALIKESLHHQNNTTSQHH